MGVDLLIGGHTQNKTFKIDFKQLGAIRSRRADMKLLVNFYRGYRSICDKAEQVLTIRTYCARQGLDVSSVMPDAFVFNSSDDKKNEQERAAFLVRLQ